MRSWYTGAGACLALSVVAIGGSGCAAVGSGQFSCPGRPEGVRCASAREVYELTQQADSVEATADRALGNNPSRAAAARQAQGERAAAAAQAAQPQAAPATPTSPRAEPSPAEGGAMQVSTGSGMPGAALFPQVDRPTPVRTPAQVMRVWLAPWEDTRGVLHIGGYHYVEVVARRWTLGGPVNSEPARMFSINEPIFDPESGADAEGETAGAAPVFGPNAGTQVGLTGN